jgi:DNA polymerase-3 subunit delta
MIAQLKDILQDSLVITKAIESNLYILHASRDDYPLVNYVTTYIKQQINFAAATQAISSRCNNLTFTADKYFNFSTINNIISNQSLFSETNYIEITYKTKPTQEQQTAIINLIPRLQDNNFLVIITDKLTKKDLDAQWLKNNNDSSIGDNKPNRSNKPIILGITNYDCKIIIHHMFSMAKLSITTKAIDMLLQLNMANVAQLMQEANKIIIHKVSDNGTNNTAHIVDVEHIKELILDNSKYNIYQLSNAYLAGNLANALNIFDNLYQTTEDAILITWIFAEDLRKLLKIKNKIKQKQDISQALYELRIIKDSAHNFMLAEKRINYQKLIILFNQVADLDMAIKGVVTADILQIIRQIIIQFSSNK